MTSRSVSPEILDSLPYSDPSATRSRRDLRIINRAMGNGGWWRRVLKRRIPQDARILEIGAGAGDLQQIARTLRVDGLDRHPSPPGWPTSAFWHHADASTFDGWSGYDAVIGNLIFHHFEPATLALLGTRISQHARIIAACEPRRGCRFERGFGLLCLAIGADPVTRHDGRVSIAAGFRGDELPRLLGLDDARWRWQIEETSTGACRMFASRTR